MKHGLGLRILLGYVLVVAAFLIISPFTEARLLIKIGDGFAVPMSIAACSVYFLELWRRPAKEPITATDMVMLGITGGWMVNSVDRALRLWSRLFDVTWVDQPVIGLFLFMLTYFAALHVLVRGGASIQSGKSMRGGRIVAVALFIGLLAAAAIIYEEVR